MENPALSGASVSHAGELDTWKHTRSPDRLQAILDRAIRHEWPAEALGALLALRLDRPRLILVAAGGLMALDSETGERLAESVLADLRRGQPVPALTGLREEARFWAAFASPAERRAYSAAIWGRLPGDERRDFLRAVRGPT